MLAELVGNDAASAGEGYGQMKENELTAEK
jgi:hypothetical protein